MVYYDDVRTLFPKDYGRKRTKVSDENPSDQPSAPQLNPLDRKIVRLLQKNGRLSNTEVARELSVTETTIRKRVGRMLEEGLIEFLAVPTQLAVGSMIAAIIGVTVNLRQLDEVSAQAIACPEVRYVGVAAGRYDLILEGIFSSHEHLLRFLATSLGQFEGVVSAETSIILKVAKFSYEWELP
jgi:Lrp/AsnC family transcriptional regulator for asnA, asnC and gidA